MNAKTCMTGNIVAARTLRTLAEGGKLEMHLSPSLLGAAGFKQGEVLRYGLSDSGLTISRPQWNAPHGNILSFGPKGGWIRTTRLDTQSDDERQTLVALVRTGEIVLQPFHRTRHASLLVEMPDGALHTELAAVLREGPLPDGPTAIAAKAYTDVSVFTVGSKYPVRKLEIAGEILGTVCGLEPGMKLTGQKYADGVWLRADEYGQMKVGRKTRKGSTWPLIYSSNRQLFGDLLDEAKLRVIFGNDAVVVAKSDVDLRRFGLKEGATIHALLRPSGPFSGERRTVTNTSYYGMPAKGRLQISGAWLANFGFSPGARYRVSDFELKSGTKLIELDPAGPYAVTRLTAHADFPKLYLPNEHANELRASDKTQVRVQATKVGLLVY